MPGDTVTVEKLTPHIGAEIHGVDLGRPLDESTFKQIHDALIENSVIFFRDQHLSPESQKAFAARAVKWDLDTNVNRRMAYNHYFGRKPAAKKA